MKSNRLPKMHIVGLTGGIASGKSTVASFFRDYGVPVIDADQIARELRAPGGKASDSIVARFGTLDRAKLREIISLDASARKDLEAILHPLIRHESEVRFEFWRNHRAPYLVYEATLLIESGRHESFDGVILVSAHEDFRLERLMSRDEVQELEARRFLDAQNSALVSNEVRKKATTHFIENHGSMRDLRESTRLLHLEFLARSLRER